MSLLLALIYNAVLLGVCGFAWVRGGRPERIGVAINLVASCATMALQLIDVRFFAPAQLVMLGIEAAALRALEIEARNYPSVKSILEKGLDKVPVRQTPERAPILHTNIRGSGYYH